MPPLVTDAVLLPDPPHTEVAAVMFATGKLAIVIALFPDDALQPLLFFIVTASVTVPDAPAV